MPGRMQQGVERSQKVELVIDGRAVSAWAGETLASVLLVQDYTAFYQTRSGAPRAPYCNMGTCFECRVHLANRGWVLACMTPAEPGMVVRTGLQLPQPLRSGADPSES